MATFHGQVTIDQLKIRDLERSQNFDGGVLAQAGEKALKLAEALRAKHYDAYVLHDRYASIVTVGSYNSVGSSRPDGRIEINPQIHEIMQKFSAMPAPGANGAMMPKTLLGISFDIQAIPVEVPRRSISADYRHELVGAE